MKSALHILSLEDDENDAELIKAMISARWTRCDLVRVDSRDDFVAALEKGNFDLILGDYTVPGFDGMEALKLAREKRPEIPFLFVSGTIGEDTAVEALKNGATDYVLKDRLMRLIPAVSRALAEAEEHAERQRAEEAMRQSEYKYRELFESLGDAALLADEQGGKIIDANRQAEILLHCSRAKILGHQESQFLVLTQTRKPAAKQPAAVIQGGLIRSNGVVIPVDVRTTRLKLYGRPLILRLCHELN